MMKLTQADTGRTIELHISDILEVVLPANPMTGFQWEVSANDNSILCPSGEPEFEPFSGTIGSGGEAMLRFEAVGSGQTALSLIYHQPFEEHEPPTQIFEVNVIVR
jgi:predicted secreted protein